MKFKDLIWGGHSKRKWCFLKLTPVAVAADLLNNRDIHRTGNPAHHELVFGFHRPNDNVRMQPEFASNLHKCARYLALVLLSMALWTAPGFAAITKVQCVPGDWVSGGSFQVSITATAGHALTVQIEYLAGNSGDTISTISDTHNTYTIVEQPGLVIAGVNAQAVIAVSTNITGGSLTVTISSLSATFTAAHAQVCEWSGLTTAQTDPHTHNPQTNPGAGANAVTSGATTATSAADLVVASVVSFGQTLTIGTVPSYTSIDTGSFFANEYLVQGASGTVAGTFTGSDGTGSFLTSVATFTPSGGGGGRSLVIGGGVF